MEKIINKIRESIESLTDDFNGRSEEVRENFASFKEVFGKEFELQTEHLKEYGERLETRGKDLFDWPSLSSDVREKVGYAVKDVRTAVDQLFDTVKEVIDKVK